jgi:hypothetical protein
MVVNAGAAASITQTAELLDFRMRATCLAGLGLVHGVTARPLLTIVNITILVSGIGLLI